MEQAGVYKQYQLVEQAGVYKQYQLVEQASVYKQIWKPSVKQFARNVQC